MSRELASWAHTRKHKTRPRLTWPRDVVESIRRLVRRRVPASAPPMPPHLGRGRLRAQLSGRHLMLKILSLRLDMELVGADALRGLQQPLVFAANEQGVLDYQLLRRSLPSRMRPTISRPSRALARGRNVVIFAEGAVGGRLVGEFDTVPADLASQHDVALVPVGLVGTFKLKDIMKLALRTKPKVLIRFGAPIYVRGRSLSDATKELQQRVDRLVHEGELSWWTVEQRRTGGPDPLSVTPKPRWRRLWEQAAPTQQGRGRIWR